jgi:hypothetical protein
MLNVSTQSGASLSSRGSQCIILPCKVQTADATTQYEIPDNDEEDEMESSNSDDAGDPEWHPSQEDLSDDSLTGDEEHLVFDELILIMCKPIMSAHFLCLKVVRTS